MSELPITQKNDSAPTFGGPSGDTSGDTSGGASGGAFAGAADAIAHADSLSGAAAFVGFDGCIDSIIRLVDSRPGDDPNQFTPIRTLADFAQRIANASGRSANIEMVVERTKLGGNGPILASALAKLGAPVTCAAAVGKPNALPGDPPHPIYNELKENGAQLFNLGPAGATDACEFDDGKIMLGKNIDFQCVSWDRLLKAVGGADAFVQQVNNARIIATCNWTMLRAMGEIWERLAREIIPRCQGAKRVYVDLADPAKRSDADLAGAMSQLRELDAASPVTLGVNIAEAARLAQLVGVSTRIDEEGFAPESLADAAASLRAALRLSELVIHNRRGAGAAVAADSESVDRAALAGPFINDPVISTGAGDHFGAGWCFGLGLGLPLDQRLACAVGVSGLYVRTGASPAREELTNFLRTMPEPEVREHEIP